MKKPLDEKQKLALTVIDSSMAQVRQWQDLEDNFSELDKKVDKIPEEIMSSGQEIKDSIESGFSDLQDTLKKKLEEELLYEVDEQKIVDSVLAQVKIPDPIPGKDADEEAIIKKMVPLVLDKVPKVEPIDLEFIAKEASKLVPKSKSQTVKQIDKDLIVSEVLQKLPKLEPFKFELTQDDLLNRINKFDHQIDWKVLKNIPYDVLHGGRSSGKIGRGGATRFTQLIDAPSSYSGQAGKFPKVKATEDGLEFATVSVSTPSLQQVTDVGATTTVESTFSGGTISNKVKANSSAGFLIEANNGTDVGLLGVGNTANVSWYGNHNYTGRLYAQRDNGGATPVEGMVVDNTTNATASVLQSSPSFLRRGRGFLSNSSTSYPFETQDYAIGEVGLTAYGKWIHQFKANNGSWQEFMRFDSAPLGQGFSITPGQALSNGTPGTTRNFTINNTGSHSWIDFVFSGVRKSHIGAGSSGEMKFYAGGGSYFEYYQMSGDSLFSYNYPTAFVHYASGFFGGSLHVGATSTPTSTFQNEGGTSLKVAYSNVNLTLDNTATQWILEPSTASCIGTPTYVCSHWTNQTDCELRDSHGGCSWYAGDPCSAFDNESGMATCASTSGCSVDTASCSGAGDESTCLAQDDNYGGSCSWNGTDCGALSEGACGSTSGCSSNYSDCSTFGDEFSCTATSGCSWDGMSCSGTYFSGCSGTYYNCDGTYNTGSCSGTYGAACTGTSACAGIDDSTSCGGEGGCTWSTSITATLPNGDSFPSRTLWVYKKGATGTVVLTPNAGQTVNFASTYTMSSDKEWVHLAYYNLTANCNVYDGNESTCGSTSGCTQNYSFCSWDSGMSTCSGNAVCTGIGDELTCTSTSWFSSCTGTYSLSKNWYKFGS